MSNFIFALPVAHIDLLAQRPESMESQRFADWSNLVFQTIQKSKVEQAVERAISIVLDLGGEAVEVHDVLRNVVRVLHPEVLKLMLGIGDGVVRSERTL